MPGGVPLGIGLTTFGVANYLGGVSELSNALYGGDRDYNFLKQGFSTVSTSAGLDPSVGSRVYTAIDFGLNVPLLFSPTWVTAITELKPFIGPPMLVQTSALKPAIANGPSLQQSLDIYGLIDQTYSYEKGK